MTTSKQLKLAHQVAGQQQTIISELQALVKDIERCEKTILALNTELAGVNAKYGSRRTTQEDIQFLEAVLACAKKKLIWEKQMVSLQKRTPALMQRVENLVNHPQSSPDEQTRKDLLESLHNIQGAMQRLQSAKGERPAIEETALPPPSADAPSPD
ncbi:MAG TPA: hypothetical protein VGR78_12615 [Verrucomicrobiae bacterium]|nr:hypothetical protein [Verrucomicrobiae bacterium]